MELHKYIDHTLLSPTATKQDIDKLCKEAVQHLFFSVCVHGCYVKRTKKQLENSSVKVCCVVGFPLGAMTTKAKVFETKNALKNGADEIDMVINISALKNKNYKKVLKDIQSIKRTMPLKVLKVILETGYLSAEEIKKASELSLLAGANFIKTSTGFGLRGASIEDIMLMKDATQGKIKIKASGGVKTAQMALDYIAAGASRLGTSSGVAIVLGKTGKETY